MVSRQQYIQGYQPQTKITNYIFKFLQAWTGTYLFRNFIGEKWDTLRVTHAFKHISHQ